MPKLSKEATIELILEQLKLGITYKETFKVIQSKTKLVESTFASYWKIANEKHKEAQELLNKQADEQTIDEKVKAQNKALNDAKERKDILQQKFIEVSKVRRGVSIYKDKDGKVERVKITLADELKAIDTLAKLDDRLSKADGTDKPTKTAQTDTEGKDLPNKTMVEVVHTKVDIKTESH